MAMTAVTLPASPPPYVGRFAPSPTGPLHFGSLVGALASFCEARSVHGQWLVRMEDLDPPREIPGSADAILRSLDAHGLQSDGDVLFQSTRLAAYGETLDLLADHNLTYPCICTRKAIAALGGVYPGTCRVHSVEPEKTPATDFAVRLKVSNLPTSLHDMDTPIQFDDVVFGTQTQSLTSEVGDFIIKRKDGLFAYQLAVVVDDIFQGITHIFRGSDLLDSTPQQLYLFRVLSRLHQLNRSEPVYGHCPVVLNELGQKLSKQHHAKAIDDNAAADNLFRALVFLQQQPPTELRGASVGDILHWAVSHWRRDALPAISGAQESSS